MHRSQISAVIVGAFTLLALAPGARAQDAGETVFKRYCAICHSVEAGVNKIGPSLNGVVERKAGSAPGFNYTSANKDSGITWDDKTLDEYLTDPRAKIPGTKMLFAGLKNPDDRKAVIAYLAKQK